MAVCPRRRASRGFSHPRDGRSEMTADLEALVVAAYVFADEYPGPDARPGWMGAGDRRRVHRSRRLPGGDGNLLGSPVPRPGGEGPARLVSASPLPVAVQPTSTRARLSDRRRAAAARAHSSTRFLPRASAASPLRGTHSHAPAGTNVRRHRTRGRGVVLEHRSVERAGTNYPPDTDSRPSSMAKGGVCVPSSIDNGDSLRSGRDPCSRSA